MKTHHIHALPVLWLAFALSMTQHSASAANPIVEVPPVAEQINPVVEAIDAIERLLSNPVVISILVASGILSPLGSRRVREKVKLQKPKQENDE